MSAYRQSHTDDKDFKCLFDAYKNRLYGYVLSLSHSAYVAEEITQEIFIKLWVCRDILDQVDHLDGYIFTMARNKTLNHLRKATHDAKLLRELQGRMVPENNNVEEYALTSDYEKQVQEALRLLSPQRRLVYQLSRNNGLKHHEIAQQLCLSQHTVKNHLVEALRFIRNHLGRYSILLSFMVLSRFWGNLW